MWSGILYAVETDKPKEKERQRKDALATEVRILMDLWVVGKGLYLCQGNLGYEQLKCLEDKRKGLYWAPMN